MSVSILVVDDEPDVADLFRMPGMDGLALLDEVKRRLPDLPVMTITAYGDDARRRLAGELGAAEFLTKPVDLDRLKAQLRQLPTAAD